MHRSSRSSRELMQNLLLSLTPHLLWISSYTRGRAHPIWPSLSKPRCWGIQPRPHISMTMHGALYLPSFTEVMLSGVHYRTARGHHMFAGSHTPAETPHLSLPHAFLLALLSSFWSTQLSGHKICFRARKSQCCTNAWMAAVFTLTIDPHYYLAKNLEHQKQIL